MFYRSYVPHGVRPQYPQWYLYVLLIFVAMGTIGAFVYDGLLVKSHKYDVRPGQTIVISHLDCQHDPMHIEVINISSDGSMQVVLDSRYQTIPPVGMKLTAPNCQIGTIKSPGKDQKSTFMRIEVLKGARVALTP